MTLIADAEGATSGFISGSFTTDLARPVGTADIEALYVVEKSRRLGVGSALLRAFIFASEAAGMAKTQVSFYAGNLAAKALYEKHGLKPHIATYEL
jgi:ribosomal protein S18 acetylase RimI-like enzyme